MLSMRIQIFNGLNNSECMKQHCTSPLSLDYQLALDKCSFFTRLLMVGNLASFTERREVVLRVLVESDLNDHVVSCSRREIKRTCVLFCPHFHGPPL